MPSSVRQPHNACVTTLKMAPSVQAHIADSAQDSEIGKK